MIGSLSVVILCNGNKKSREGGSALYARDNLELQESMAYAPREPQIWCVEAKDRGAAPRCVSIPTALRARAAPRARLPPCVPTRTSSARSTSDGEF